ncbi:Pathogenicity locus [Pseudoflavonifractor sp. 524-17]|uniref:helix-hairpin-helix domain-containing protein n=1 Tax=Pseudoflavonifractor sp. 524-17 TaxID=2304577 RepID=UPI00137B834D|nr:helix-hairpin-helix domain-containing protein [Pseudoflavonifractor sp. 524-17]NCE63396.1 Pathogenicity locus [Pseudoflavonifractor sp. 524-17]
MGTELQRIPGVGKNMAQRLKALGIHTLADLRGQDPEALYQRDCLCCGEGVDRCVLYVYRLAVAFAEDRITDPEQLKWWNWSDERLSKGREQEA